MRPPWIASALSAKEDAMSYRLLTVALITAGAVFATQSYAQLTINPGGPNTGDRMGGGGGAKAATGLTSERMGGGGGGKGAAGGTTGKSSKAKSSDGRGGGGGAKGAAGGRGGGGGGKGAMR